MIVKRSYLQNIIQEEVETINREFYHSFLDDLKEMRIYFPGLLNEGEGDQCKLEDPIDSLIKDLQNDKIGAAKLVAQKLGPRNVKEVIKKMEEQGVDFSNKDSVDGFIRGVNQDIKKMRGWGLTKILNLTANGLRVLRSGSFLFGLYRYFFEGGGGGVIAGTALFIGIFTILLVLVAAAMKMQKLLNPFWRRMQKAGGQKTETYRDAIRRGMNDPNFIGQLADVVPEERLYAGLVGTMIGKAREMLAWIKQKCRRQPAEPAAPEQPPAAEQPSPEAPPRQRTQSGRRTPPARTTSWNPEMDETILKEGYHPTMQHLIADPQDREFLNECWLMMYGFKKSKFKPYLSIL